MPPAGQDLDEARERILEDVREGVEYDTSRALYPGLASHLARAGFKNKRVFLRFGELPASGRSERGFLGAQEVGASCFSARRSKAGHFVIAVHNSLLRAEFIRLCQFEERPAFILYGKVVGRDDAREPLLKVQHAEPLPDGAIVAADPASRALERWNELKTGGFLDELVPELNDLQRRTL